MSETRTDRIIVEYQYRHRRIVHKMQSLMHYTGGIIFIESKSNLKSSPRGRVAELLGKPIISV